MPTIAKGTRAIGLAAVAVILPGGLVFSDWYTIGGLLRTGSFPPSWNWPWVLGFNAFYVSAILIVAGAIFPWWTEFSAEGVAYLNWSGRHLLPWHGLTEIVQGRRSLELRWGGKPVTVNLSSYQDPATVLAYIASAAPQAVVRPAA